MNAFDNAKDEIFFRINFSGGRKLVNPAVALINIHVDRIAETHDNVIMLFSELLFMFPGK